MDYEQITGIITWKMSSVHDSNFHGNPIKNSTIVKQLPF
jgi:hypothetical protein